MSKINTKANHFNRTKEMKLQQIASRILVKPTKLCQTLRSALVTIVVRISSTPRNSLVEVALAAAWVHKSTPRSSSRCLVDRWAVVASVEVALAAAWAVVPAEVVVASLEDSTSVEKCLELETPSARSPFIRLTGLLSRKEVAQSSPTSCLDIYTGLFVLFRLSLLTRSFWHDGASKEQNCLRRCIWTGVLTLFAKVSRPGYRLFCASSYTSHCQGVSFGIYKFRSDTYM